MVTVRVGLSLLICRYLKVQHIFCVRSSGSFHLWIPTGQILPLSSDPCFKMEEIDLWRHLFTGYRGNVENGPPTNACLSGGRDQLNPESRSQEFRALSLPLPDPEQALSKLRPPWAMFCVAAHGRAMLFLRRVSKQLAGPGVLSATSRRAPWCVL